MALADLSTYPDIVVICGSLDASESDANAAINPLLIVELLSDSTEGYNRGERPTKGAGTAEHSGATRS